MEVAYKVNSSYVRCYECGWKGEYTDVLKAPSPFKPLLEIDGCPCCLDVETMEFLCDEPGCWEKITCGTPTPEGYKRTCRQHKP